MIIMTLIWLALLKENCNINIGPPDSRSSIGTHVFPPYEFQLSIIDENQIKLNQI